MDARRAQMELLAKVTEENDRLKKDLTALRELHEKEKKNLSSPGKWPQMSSKQSM